MRLNRFLASAGLGSRRSCEELIQNGWVSINNQPCTKLATEVAPDDEVRVHGRLVQTRPLTYVILSKPTGYVCTRSDPHAERTIYDLLPPHLHDLAHVGRVSTVGELTASLAHELNQPLTAILSNAEAAQDVLDIEPTNLRELREILTDIAEDDRRAVEVIHRLRGLLKKGRLELVSLDANEVVGEVVRLIGGDVLLHNVRVRLELADALPSVQGDRVQLRWRHLERCEVSYYLLDVELSFSAHPFVQQLQQGSGAFAFVRPNVSREQALPAGQEQLWFDVPEALRSRNLLVEARAGGVVARELRYASSLAVRTIDSYGQVEVTHATSGKPLPAVIWLVIVQPFSSEPRQPSTSAPPATPTPVVY